MRLAFKGRNLQPAFAMLDQQAAPFQHLQRVAHRLARNTEHRRDALLRQPLSGLQRAIGDRIQQEIVHLIDQRRLEVEMQY